MVTLITAITYNTAKACVDYHPVPPPVTVIVDSAYTKIEITVHQLNIFAGGPGAFCTCAISAYTNLFSAIYYVAFVDSGTTNPINGFAVWNANANATTEWSGVMPGTEWSGFVASVINTMTPGLPVELIIRANLPPGYTLTDIDSTLTVSSLGTDQWDNTLNVLAYTHNSISGFGVPTYFVVSPNYFTGIEDFKNNSGIHVFPNPNNGKFSVTMNSPGLLPEMEIHNMAGQKVYQQIISGQQKTEIDLSSSAKGVYFYSLRTKEGILTKGKLIVE